MKLSDKLKYLREVEGSLRGLGRAMTQQELVRAIAAEMDSPISQSYLSQIESGARAHLTNLGQEQVILKPETILSVVADFYGLSVEEVRGSKRLRPLVHARHVAMYLCKQRLKCSFPELGRAFGNRDHTTVMSAVRKVEALRTSDPEVRAHLEAIERKLGAAD